MVVEDAPVSSWSAGVVLARVEQPRNSQALGHILDLADGRDVHEERIAFIIGIKRAKCGEERFNLGGAQAF